MLKTKILGMGRWLAIAMLLTFSMSLALTVQAEASAIFDLATGTGDGDGWTWNNPVLTVHNGATIEIIGAVTNGRRIVANGTSSITLRDVSISGITTTNSSFLLNPGAHVTLTLVGTNELRGGRERAGIQAPAGTTLIIEGTDGAKGVGSLTTIGTQGGAGIGGGVHESGGAITINSGIVTALNVIANGIADGAGIGGGGGGTGGSAGIITINGGTVIATGGDDRSSGIGTGGGTVNSGAGGIVIINGGTVTATGGHGRPPGEGGAAIGGRTSTVEINGGTVIANGGGNNGPGITGNTLTIASGDVTARSSLAGGAITSATYTITIPRYEHRTSPTTNIDGVQWVLSDVQPFVNSGFGAVQIRSRVQAAVDYVFVLDRSGSMGGQPIIDLRVAAADLAVGILTANSEARIAVVIYDNRIDTLVCFTENIDAAEIRRRIGSITARGGTDIRGGLDRASYLFDNHSDESHQRVIVHFSDGVPNNGAREDGPFYSRYKNAVYNKVTEFYTRGITKYSIVLYGGITAGTGRTRAQNFMMRIATPDAQHFGFANTQAMGGVMAAVLLRLTGTEPNAFQVVTIGCPVHVTVRHTNGSTVTSNMNLPNAVTVTTWGRIDFSGANRDIKTVHLYEDIPFTIELQGYNNGTMDFTISYFDAYANLLERYAIRNVPITSATRMTVSTDNSSGNIVLRQSQPTPVEISVPLQISTAPSPYAPPEFDIEVQDLGVDGTFDAVRISETGGFTGNVRVRIRRLDYAGNELHTEEGIVALSNGMGIYSGVSPLAHIQNMGDYVEIIVYDEFGERELSRLVVALTVFEF